MSSTSVDTASAVTSSSTTPTHFSVNNTFAPSPIQKLPAELLEDICHYVLPPKGLAIPCVRHECWLLSKICQCWRNVVLCSARLWRNIDIYVPVIAQLRNPVALLSLALSRTSQADLFISFDNRSPMDDDGVPVDSDDSSELALTLLEILMTCSTQWHTVEFITLGLDCASALAGVRGRLPRLFSLDIPWMPAVDTVIHFTSAPQLKELCVRSPAEDVLSRFPLQKQLTTFEVDGSAYDSSLGTLLRECSDLRRLSMKFSQPSPAVSARVVAELTVLFFAGDFHDLTLIHLPKLNKLRIGDRDAVSLETALPFVLDLLKYSQCPLDHLGLINCDLSVGSLTKILEVLPDLTVMVIIFQSFTMSATAIVDVDQALSRLMIDMGKVDLVPKLEALIIIFHKANVSPLDFTFFRPREVAAMLGGRIERSKLEAYCQFDGVLIDKDGWQR